MSTVAGTIARILVAKANCEKNGNKEWSQKHANRLAAVCKEYLPSGAGLDAGTRINLEKTTGKRLVFTTSFHHMDEQGSYDGWTEHTITVTPEFDDIDIRVSGSNRNDISRYLADVFYDAMRETVDEGRVDRAYAAAQNIKENA